MVFFCTVKFQPSSGIVSHKKSGEMLCVLLKKCVLTSSFVFSGKCHAVARNCIQLLIGEEVFLSWKAVH